MIKFSNVTKQFGDSSYALKDVSFDVERGELVCITGPSGSGKTTLMRLLTKEYEPTEGEIIFNDHSLQGIRRSQVHQHRRQIGVIFQDYKLLTDQNVWENIALPLYITGKPQAEIESRVTDLLQLVNLTEKAFLFPNQLSGGEAQRVSIARALATGPGVIFADEPTGNLDPETSIAIAKLLHKINELGTTIMLATHDLGVIEALPKARRIHLDKGSLTKDSHAGKKHKVIAQPVEVKHFEPQETVAKNSAKKTNSKKKWSPTWPFGKKKPQPADSSVNIIVEDLE